MGNLTGLSTILYVLYPRSSRIGRGMSVRNNRLPGSNLQVIGKPLVQLESAGPVGIGVRPCATGGAFEPEMPLEGAYFLQDQKLRVAIGVQERVRACDRVRNARGVLLSGERRAPSAHSPISIEAAGISALLASPHPVTPRPRPPPPPPRTRAPPSRSHHIQPDACGERLEGRAVGAVKSYVLQGSGETDGGGQRFYHKEHIEGA